MQILLLLHVTSVNVATDWSDPLLQTSQLTAFSKKQPRRVHATHLLLNLIFRFPFSDHLIPVRTAKYSNIFM
jgi:hypothetical protein